MECWGAILQISETLKKKASNMDWDSGKMVVIVQIPDLISGPFSSMK